MAVSPQIQALPTGLQTGTPGMRLSELLSALSHALDLTEGQPEGHCIRCCWIGTCIGRELGLPEAQLWELYYTLLLKDLGCSSNAARIAQLYKTDDLAFKRDAKLVNGGVSQGLAFLVAHSNPAVGLVERLRTLLAAVPRTPAFVREIIGARCERGADIARRLHFSEDVAAGIHDLDEHWNGKGMPAGKKGPAIPIYAQIALLAQVAEVFHFSAGGGAAVNEIRRRAGTWFDPALVASFLRAAARPDFWDLLAAPDLESAILDYEPARTVRPVDDEYLDDIASAFGEVVDSKSPYTSGHSTRVAELTDLIASELGFTPARRRWLKRGALLHDIGKLGVSSQILDKPGKLNAAEWKTMQCHATLTEKVLSRIGAFGELAAVAGAHHERLDGTGYPRGLRGGQIALETRVLTTADIFDALTADRPYRKALSEAEALGIMAGEVGGAVDVTCFAALRMALAGRDRSRAEPTPEALGGRATN